MACNLAGMLGSILLHVVAVVLILLLCPSPVMNDVLPLKERKLRNRILLRPVPAPSKGGGGSQSPQPPSRGERPRYALRQFTPPVVAPVNLTPRLAVEPTIVMDAKMDLARMPDSPIGLPDGIPGPPSGGPGRRGGIGGGDSGGVGDGSGAGMEGLPVEPLRAGMKAPVVLFKTEPEYSEQARKARVQGTIIVEGVIDERGLARALRIRDPLGFGLDEEALEAVKRWRFRPALRDGKPVPTPGTFYLTFRLL